jgi:hypothetical protein
LIEARMAGPASYAQAEVDEWQKRIKAGGSARPSPTIAIAQAAGYEHLFKGAGMAWNPLFSATTYGRKPRATGVPDEFKFRIYTGGLAGAGTSDDHATEAIEKFKSKNGYSAYEIVSRKSRWFPSCYDYTVRFRKR